MSFKHSRDSSVKDMSSDQAQDARRTGLLGAAYQGTFALVQLTCLALLARHATREVFGLWMTILALTSWAPLSYCGQPAALLTHLGAVARSDARAAQRIFTSSVVIVIGITTVSLLLLLAVTAALSWASILNAATPLSVLAAPSTAVAGLAVALLANPATISNFALLSHQRGQLVHLVMIGASLVSLCAFIFAVLNGYPIQISGPLMICGPLIGGLVLWVVIRFSALTSMPRLPAFDRITSTKMLSVGAQFVAIEVATLCLVRTPDLIVSTIYGATSVGLFSSVGRLPMLMLAVFQTVLLPYWPMLGEAMYRGDLQAVRNLVLTSLRTIAVVCSVGVAGLLALGPPFVRAWVYTDDQLIEPLVWAASMQTVGLAVLAWITAIFSALSMYRRLVGLIGLTAACYFPVALAFSDYFGPVGVAAAQAAGLLLFTAPAGAWLLHRHLSSVLAP